MDADDAADAAAYAASAAAAAAGAAADAADATYAAARAAADATYAATYDADATYASWDFAFTVYNSMYKNGDIFPYQWKTFNTIAIAQSMVESLDFSDMPILADALADVGCDNHELLMSLREEKELWCSGNWVINALVWG